MARLISGFVPLALLTVALAGCGGAPASHTEPSVEKTPSNPGIGIIRTTTMTSCDTQEGKVTATGKATVPQDVKGTATVSVSWVDPKTSVVLAHASQTLKDAKAGQPTDWTITTDLGKHTTEVKCVLSATVLPDN